MIGLSKPPIHVVDIFPLVDEDIADEEDYDGLRDDTFDA